MKKKILILVSILVVFLAIPPFVNYWVSTPSSIGFIPIEKQEVWISFYTELRTYKEIATSSGICLMFYKELSEREWKEYSNKMLEEPFKMCIDIEYDDLVGFHHKLNSLLMVKRFVHIRDEDNNVIENVLVINPYDSTIQNMTSIDS